MENYKNTEGVNQSTLKKILQHPSEYLKAVENQEGEDSEKEHFVLGKLVDLMMYDPKKIDKTFKITDLPSISDIQKDICRTIIETMELEEVKFLDQDSPANRKVVLESCKLHEYYNNRKDDTRIDGIFKDCTEYINILVMNKNKIIVGNELNFKAINCKAALLSDFRAKKYFSNEFEKDFSIDQSKDVQFFKHVIVQYEYRGLSLKGELDEVVINHKKRQIIPIDLKTLGHKIYQFKSNFWKFRYDFQAATYMLGLENHPEIKQLLGLGYTLLNFRFIVVESNTTNSPLIFEVSPEVLRAGIEGGTSKSGYEYEGLNQAIDRFKYHTEKESWDYPMEYETENIIIDL